MKTIEEKRKAAAAANVRNTVLEASKDIHARTVTHRPVLSVREYLDIPYSEILDLNISRRPISLADRTGLVNSFEGHNGSAMKDNLARIFARELDIYREIIDVMDNEIVALSDHIKNIPIEYGLPDLVVDDIPPFVELYMDTFAEDIVIPSKGKEEAVSLKGYSLYPDNIKEELSRNLAFGVSDGSKLMRTLKEAYILNIIDDLIRGIHHQYKPFKEVGVVAMFMEWLKDNRPESVLIEQCRLILVNAKRRVDVVKESTDVILDVNEQQNKVYLHAKNYKKLSETVDSAIVVGAYLSHNGIRGYDELISNVSELMSKYNTYMNKVGAQERLKQDVRVREYFKAYGTRLESLLGKAAKKRSNTFANDNTLLIRIGTALSNLKSEEMKDLSKVIETVYLEVIFKGNKFETFYKVGADYNHESATTKASSALYNLICITLLDGVTHG